MKQKLHEAFSPEESEKIYANFLAIINNPKRRDRLVRLHGANAENVAYGTAVNQVKKQATNNTEEPTIEEPMNQETRLKEMIIAALSNPVSEKKGKDMDEDGDIDSKDYLMSRDMAIRKAKDKMDEDETVEKGIIDEPISEDLDLGHEDNEPHMIKAELAQIGKYAMELYKIVDQFEGPQEVDFPAWWQSKITTAKSMISSAKHYLEFELEEPKIDAMVDVASQEGAIDENKKIKDIAEGVFDRIKAQFKGTTSDIGQRLKNVGAAIKGKPEDFQNPAVASGMSKIKSKAQNFEYDVKDMLNDLNILFPEEKLGKAPEVKELIDSYKQLLDSVLKVNTTLAKGKPVNVTTKSSTTTQTQTAPRPATAQTTTSKPSASQPTKTWNVSSNAPKTKARDEKGRFVSTKE
jgi:hypothetical protein